MFESKTPGKINWKKRQEAIKEMASLNKEKEKVLDPLEKRFKEVLERESELQRLSEKIATVSGDFNHRIFEIEKLLKAECPAEIDILIQKFKSTLSDLFSQKHFKSTSTPNVYGGCVLENNLAGIAEAKKIIQDTLAKLEDLKIRVVSEDDLVTTLDRIEKETEERVRRSLLIMTKTVQSPLPTADR